MAFDLEKYRSVGVMGRKSAPLVKEGRDSAGDRIKATRDELGHVTVEHNNSKDQVDVHLRPPTIHVSPDGTKREVRP